LYLIDCSNIIYLHKLYVGPRTNAVHPSRLDDGSDVEHDDDSDSALVTQIK